MGLIGDEYEDRVTGKRGKGDAVDDCTFTAASALSPSCCLVSSLLMNDEYEGTGDGGKEMRMMLWMKGRRYRR